MSKHIGRNQTCPCGSGKKFKQCCLGKVNWEGIYKARADFIPHLSIRGRNAYFLNRIGSILQLDSLQDRLEYKAAFTDGTVRKIYEAVLEVWPTDTNIAAALKKTADTVTGLYVGNYDLEHLKRGLVRHSLYSQKILIVDPFIYPTSVRDEYNPILNPGQHRTQTMRNVNFWLDLLPWIDAGIVEIIRTPADFDRLLQWTALQEQHEKFESNPELRRAADENAEELSEEHSERLGQEMLLLSAPDSYLRRIFEDHAEENLGITAEQFLAHVQKLRDQNPNVIAPLGPDMPGQLYMWSAGTSYNLAKLTASLTKSYLVTDLAVRWKEIQFDRSALSNESLTWSPFAHAMQNTSFKYLNAVTLRDALRLRQEDRLSSLRRFLRDVWKRASEGTEFDLAKAQLLADELEHEVSVARGEWAKIDNDLLKFVGKTTLVTAALSVVGGANFVAAAGGAIAGAVGLGLAGLQRRTFGNKFPAAFFMNIKLPR